MMIKKVIGCAGMILTLGMSSSVWANNGGINPVSDPDTIQYKSLAANVWSDFTDKVSTTWNDSDSQDLYVPVITWHNRLTYDKEKTDRYNERPWGGGYGISRYDEKGNWNGIYFMAFKDSHNKWEPIGGYGWEKYGHLQKIKTFG